MTAYYNECDPYAAQWLRNLIAAGHIAPGVVDERSIVDVRPADLAGFTQCHFFAGIGVWSYALRLAGWPDDRPVWTGSCPCQPFSSARNKNYRGADQSEDLWPIWYRFIASAKPRVVFGEQVAHGDEWIDRLGSQMEAIHYEVGAALLRAFGVGKDHARPRIYFVCHADSNSEPEQPSHAEVAPRLPRDNGNAGSVARTYGHSSRVGRLRAYGNAIVAPLAAEFIRAFAR